MEVYAVIWSSACYEVHDDTLCLQEGVEGICKSEASAKTMLEECKQSFLNEVTEANIQICGSVDAGYFILDYEQDESPVEVHIQITHTYIKD
jgi:hypothetical protein